MSGKLVQPNLIDVPECPSTDPAVPEWKMGLDAFEAELDYRSLFKAYKAYTDQALEASRALHRTCYRLEKQAAADRKALSKKIDDEVEARTAVIKREAELAVMARIRTGLSK